MDVSNLLEAVAREFEATMSLVHVGGQLRHWAELTRPPRLAKIPAHLSPDLDFDCLIEDPTQILNAFPFLGESPSRSEVKASISVELSEDVALTLLWTGTNSEFRPPQPTQVLSAATDLELLKEVRQTQAERTLVLQTQALANLEYGIVIVDEEIKTADVNPVAASFLQVTTGRHTCHDFNRALEAMWLRSKDHGFWQQTVPPVVEIFTNAPSRWVLEFQVPPLHVQISTIPLTVGPIQGKAWTFLDVSDRVEALKESIRQQEISRAALNGLIDPQILLAPIRNEGGMVVDFSVVEANQVFLDEASEDWGQNGITDASGTYSYLADPVLQDRYRLAIEHDDPVVIEEWEVDRDGTTKILTMRGSRVGTLLSLTWRDVTETTRASRNIHRLEHRLQALLTEGHVIAFRMDQMGFLEWVSKSASIIFDIAETDFVGQSAAKFCHPDDLRRFADEIGALRSTGVPRDVDFRTSKATGQLRFLEGRAFLADDASGSVEVILSDVTHHAELDRLRGIVSAAASHELRAPLAFVATGLQMLAEGVVDHASHEGQGLVSRMISATHRLGRMSETTLFLQTLELARSPAAEVPIPVFEVIERGVLSVVTERNVQVDVHDESNGAVRRLDGDLVEQAVINLVENAVRHSPEGGKVLVGVSVDSESIRVTVRDQGDGVSVEQEDQIFEPFASFDHDRRGTGLGLAIVKRIAELHRGSVRVETPEDGRGALFTLALQDLGGSS